MEYSRGDNTMKSRIVALSISLSMASMPVYADGLKDPETLYKSLAGNSEKVVVIEEANGFADVTRKSTQGSLEGNGAMIALLAAAALIIVSDDDNNGMPMYTSN